MHLAVSRYIWLLTVILSFRVLVPFDVLAEGVNFNAEFIYTRSNSDTKIKDTGQNTSTDFERFDQRYNLDISKEIYPYLIFATGSTYEYNQAETKIEGNNTNILQKRLRPFVELNLNNPIYKAGITYRKNRFEEEISDIPDTRTDRDELTATVGMIPPSKLFPEWNFSFLRELTDDSPTTIDQKRDVYNFETLYTPVRNLILDYEYTRIDTDDRFRNFDTLQQTHFGNVNYAHNFLDERLFTSAGYTVRYNKFEFPSSSSATVDVPLVRVEGLSSLDDTPEDGPALTANDALIDGNLIASAGLNIGLDGDQSTLTNIGVDFGLTLDVDQIRIWVDRELPATVANSFSWSVYTSPDNQNNSTWTLIATVAPAVFGTIDNRFEIFFPEVNTRFIKVVTRALSPTVIGAADFQNIFVTEMQAFITRTGAEVDNDTETLDQNFSLNLRGQLGDRTVAGYNLLYSRQDQDPDNLERTQVTNDIFLNHIFNQVLSFTATGQRADNSFMDDDSITYNYGASLVANWIPTFNQSLTYSGIYFDEDEGTGYQNSIFLRNNAVLYRGWSMFLDTGYGWEEPVGGSQITSTTIRAGTDVEPNRKLKFNLNYLHKRTDQSEGQQAGPDTDRQLDIQAFFIPFTTLSFFARVSLVDRDDDFNTFQNYSVNWSPFPDGDLQFFFVYNEILRSESDRTDRVIGPSLRWRIGRFGLLDLSYTFTRNEDSVQKTDATIINSDFKIIF